MKARAGVIVLVLAGLFIAGVLILTISRRARTPERAPAPAKPAELPAPVDAAPRPVEIAAPPEVEATGLRIEVVDESGKPIESARALDTKKSNQLVGASDELGLMAIPLASIQFPQRGDAVLRIEHDRFAPHFAKVRRTHGRLRITLKASAILEVEVVTTAERPFGAAEVRVDEVETSYYSAPGMRTWKTDDNGRVRVVGVPVGVVVVRAVAKGYEEGRAFVVTPDAEPRTVRVVLAEGRRVNVTVRARSGEPVAEAKVELTHGIGGMSTSFTEGSRTYYWMRMTDKNGAATFDSLPGSMNKAWLRAKARMNPKTARMIDLTDAVTDVELTLETGATMKVDVLDPQGRSVACQVVVFGRELESWPENQQDKAAGSKATFEGLPVGSPVQVTVRRNNGQIHHELGIILSAAETRELTIKVPDQWALKFVSRDKQGLPVPGWLDVTRVKGVLGPPVAGLSSDFLSYNGRLADDGTCEMSVLAGVYKAKFVPQEGAKVEKEVRVEGDTTVELEVISQATLTGLLTDPMGAPMPGVAVQWFEEGGNGWTSSDGEGRFTLKRIIGGPGKLYIGFAGVTVEAYAGSPPGGDLRIVLPLATLRGRVVQADGDPGRALVMASPVRSHGFRVGFMGGDPQPPVSTKRDGSFEMRLPVGVWHVRAIGEGSAPNPKPVEVDLPAAGTVVDVVVPLAPAK